MFQLHNFFVIQQEAIPVWTKCSIFFLLVFSRDIF